MALSWQLRPNLNNPLPLPVQQVHTAGQILDRIEQGVSLLTFQLGILAPAVSF
jgi:hypothetical protein